MNAALHIILAALVALWSPSKLIRNLAIGYAVTASAIGLWFFRHWWKWYVVGPNPWFAFACFSIFTIVLVSFLVAAFDRYHNDGPIPFPPDSWPSALGHVAWAYVQQAILLCLFVPLIGWKMAVGAFVLLHAPNLFLMGLTLVGGAFAAFLWDWQVANSLLVAGLFHALISGVVNAMFSDRLTLGFSVGLDCWKKMRVKSGW